MIEARFPSQALVLVLGLVTSLQLAQGFDTDKLYKYDFRGSIRSRVADDGKPQYSGLALSSKILVKKTGNDELTVRLEKPQSGTFNEVIEDIDHHDYDLKPIEQAPGLDKAFRIYFEAGSVKSFDRHEEEPKWVTNFKRGLLSFFQLKLRQDSSSADSSTLGPAPDSQFYTVAEKSVFGECDTDYLVASGPDNILKVTKSRNMARCKSRFMQRYLAIDVTECYDDKEIQEYKHSNAIFNYKLVGSRDNYHIGEALLEEVSTYSPFGQKAHSHVSRTKFYMALTDVESGGPAPSVDESSTSRLESLSYDPPEMLNFYANVNLEQEHHLSSIYQSSATVDQVVSALEALVQEHRSYSSAFDGTQSAETASQQEKSRIAELFIRLNKLVGTLNSQKIEQLYSQVDERGEAHKRIFWDIMSVTGTNPAFLFMKRLITEGEAPSVKIKDFLTRVSFHIKMPSKSLFDEYVNLCKSDKIQTNQQYKRLCSLPLASLIHQHCAKPHGKYLRMLQEGGNATAFKKAQNTCQMATAEEYFTRLVAPWSAASGSSDELSVGDKMFNIKMAGELGVKPSIDFLLEVIANRDEHPSLRSAAMWGLMKASKFYPNLIKRLVVPYYYDRSELLELRIAALYNWLATGMSLHELETMANQLVTEPSRQLVLYIHSIVKSLSGIGTSPCVHWNERNHRLVLESLNKVLARHAPPTMADSQATMSNTWHSEFGYGTRSLMSVIFSNESMAPSNLWFSEAEIMSGIKFNPMSVSVQAHGLDKLIKRVVGINGLLADKETFMDVFSLKRRSRRQVSAELIKQEATEIDRELKLSQREFSDVYLAVTVYVHNRPVTFFDKDSRELKKMLSEDGTIKIPQIKKLLHSFNNHTTQQMMISLEKLELFNNELGIPLYRSFIDFQYKTFKLNNVKLDVEPGFFRDERQGKPVSKISVAVDAKHGRHYEMFVSTGALVPSSRQQVGVGFHKKKLVNIPIKVSVEALLNENKVSVKSQPIHESLLYIKQSPVTFIISYEPGSASSSDSWLPLYSMNNSAHMKPFKLDYMTPLAVGLRLEGKHRAGQDWSMASWRRYLNTAGLKAASFMYSYSPTGAPLEARLSTVTTEENPTKELVKLFSWRHSHALPAGELTADEKELEAATDSEPARGRPSTVTYRLALVGGSLKERRLALDINYSRSFERLLHKWRVFYQRTPLDQTAPHSEVTNLCWLGQLTFPRHQASKLLAFDLLDLDHSANLTSELTFGDDCAQSKAANAAAHVSAKFTADWSDEQRKMIEAALKDSPKDEEASTRNSYLHLYKQCQVNREKTGNKLDSACVQLLKQTGELRHISATFDHKDVPERWTKLVRRLGSLYTYARAGYIEEIDDKPHWRDYKSADGKQERAHLEANITSGSTNMISYEFDTPSYHVMYRNLPTNLPPVSTFPLLDASYYNQLKLRTDELSCSVGRSSVTTFDKLTYTMPPVGDGCFKLIAKDCSPENNFIVLGAKVGSGKVVKVYLGQKFKVEFVPDKDGRRISDIKVNGETVAIEQGQSPFRRDTKLGNRSVEALAIDYNGSYYTLRSKLYRFAVSTDGIWILVQQSKYYAGKSCGICGDANGDHLLEFKSPVSAKKICKNANDFVWAHVLPSTCASRPASIECA